MAKSKLEALTENWCKDYAWNTYGFDSVKMKLLERAGEPDRLFLVHGGRPLFIEFKREGREPGPLQQHRIYELRGWGYDVEACDNKADGKAIIDKAAAKAGIKPIGQTVGAKKLPAPSRKVLPKQWMRSSMGRPRGR